MSALHHMASPSVLWREKPGQHQWLVLHSMPLHLLLCVVRNQQRGNSNENRTLGVHPASEIVWDRKVCGFSFWLWFSVLFRIVLSRRQKFNWLCLVLLRNQELEFGKSPRRKEAYGAVHSQLQSHLGEGCLQQQWERKVWEAPSSWTNAFSLSADLTLVIPVCTPAIPASWWDG